MMPLSSSKTLQGVLCGAGAGALWGLVFLAPEVVHGFGPLPLTIGRYFFYGLISLFILAPRWRSVFPRLTRQEWKGLAALGLIGNVLYYVLLATAVKLGGIAMTSLVIGFLPVAVSFVGSRESGAVSLSRLAPSLLLCLAGTFCIGWQALSSQGSGHASEPVLGFFFAIGALISWTWFAIANRRWLERLEQVSELDWNLLTGVSTALWTLLLVPIAAVLEPSSHTPSDWLRLVAVSIGIALFASIVGNALWNRMSRLLPLTMVGQMILFETLFALIYGFLWEQRAPTVWETASFVLVSVSVVTCLSAHRQASSEASASST